MSPRCDQCDYFSRLLGENICRRYPPVQALINRSWVFPTVSVNDWCGEYCAENGKSIPRKIDTPRYDRVSERRECKT